MNAWVTLLTDAGYVPGVRALRASLARVGSAYPLVVMVTPDVEPADRALLAGDGCVVHEIEPLRPPSGLTDAYANARFAQVWSKLAVWRLTVFERVVCLDADMLVVRDMDGLFDLELGDGEIAACHACRCNPNRIPSYPASWTPERCHYSHVPAGAGTGLPTGPAEPDDYLNGGVLVLRPDEGTFADLMAELAEVEDLTRYPFAEQDFLNEHFAGRWRPLPYVYNALKTLPHQHPGLWDADAVKNLHFIIDKPWQKALDPQDPYYALDRIWWDIAGPVLAADAELAAARQVA